MLLLSLFVYGFTRQHTDREFFVRMFVRAGVAAKAKFEADSNNLNFYNEIRENHLQRLPEEKEYFFNSIDEAVRTMPVVSVNEAKALLMSDERIQFRKNGRYYVGMIYRSPKQTSVVFVSALNKVGEKMLANLANNLLFGFLVSVALMYIASVLMAREIVHPLINIIRNTKKITASNLHLRLPVTNSIGETSEITQTVNDMLDRLETSFETQSNFLNKAAHELRTPLTAILGEAELALSKPRTSAEYKAALNVIAREAEQMRHHTSSLLELAQAGYNAKEPFMGEMRMDELIFEVKRLVDVSDPHNQVQIMFDALPEKEEEITIKGNTNLLKLALANIVQNACKYSEQQPVFVSLQSDHLHCVVTVQDSGIGIPEKEIKYIFDPFFRASNTAAYKGYGVGLPLAQKIIRLHRGELRYYSREGAGTTVTIMLPLA